MTKEDNFVCILEHPSFYDLSFLLQNYIFLKNLPLEPTIAWRNKKLTFNQLWLEILLFTCSNMF